MLVDTNILLYAADESSPYHHTAKSWLEEALNGPRLVALPWQSLIGFLRIATHPRALRNPLPPAKAWNIIEAWLDAPGILDPSTHQGIPGHPRQAGM